MKKILALLLALAMLTALCACGDNSPAASTEMPAPAVETPAPVTEAPASAWVKNYYLDAFKAPTEEYYLGTASPVEGSFNSESVSEGKLKAEVRVDAEKLCVYLFENGDKQVKNGGLADISCPVSVKRADGSVLQAEGLLPSGGDCVVVPEKQARILSGRDPAAKENSIAAALCAEGGELSIYITREDQPATNYLFSVSCGDFAALYDAEIALPIQQREARFAAGWNTIAAGYYHTVGLRADGTVLAVGDNSYGQCEISDWTDIVTVAAGGNHTVGLRADGTVVAVGDNYDGQCEVSDWTNIVAIAAGAYHTVGLRADGTVVATAVTDPRFDNGQCDVSDWTDIVAIAAGRDHTLGLRADGTVVAVGLNNYGQCEVSDWTDIVALVAGDAHTLGLRADGTVAAVGLNEYDQSETSDWTDIVAIAVGSWHTVGLRADGTVETVGYNQYGQCNVSDWTDVVAIAANGGHTVGLRADGTVLAVGDNWYGQCEISDWTDIRLPAAAKASP